MHPLGRSRHQVDGNRPLEALRGLALRTTPVALVLSDQRMPGIGGVELLAEAATRHPDAQLVLLTAYADTDVAIAAINTVGVDYCILKPWDPPEERLYPVLDDLLEDRQAGFRPPFEGMRLIGHRWSPEAHRPRWRRSMSAEGWKTPCGCSRASWLASPLSGTTTATWPRSWDRTGPTQSGQPP